MINTDKLRGVMVERRKTYADVANAIGITPRTFSDRMKKGVFGSDEIDKMIEYLQIQKPKDIFFVQK